MNIKRILSNAILIGLITSLTSMLSGNPDTLIPATSTIIVGLIAFLTELKMDFEEEKGIIYRSRLFQNDLLLI